MCDRFFTKVVFCLGHVQNDLCAAVWFTFLLTYLRQSLSVSQASLLPAGIILMGQLVDAFSVPIIGSLSDKWPGFGKFGQRKSCHLAGTLLMSITFPMVFCTHFLAVTAATSVPAIFCAVLSIFAYNVGCATVQVAHAALLCTVTSDSSAHRTSLNAYKQFVGILAGCTTYAIDWLVFRLCNHSCSPTVHSSIVSFAVTGLGAFSSLIFLLLAPEHQRATDETDSLGSGCMQWLRRWHFYLVCFVYMLARLHVVLNQVYLPVFLRESLLLDDELVALAPLVLFAGGLVAMCATNIAARHVSFNLLLIGGCALGIVAAVWFALSNAKHSHWNAFGASFVTGSAGSSTVVAALVLACYMVGPQTQASGFVFGTLTFFDKLLNGLLIVVLEHLGEGARLAHYYKLVVVAGGAATLIGVLCLKALIEWRLQRK